MRGGAVPLRQCSAWASRADHTGRVRATPRRRRVDVHPRYRTIEVPGGITDTTAAVSPCATAHGLFDASRRAPSRAGDRYALPVRPADHAVPSGMVRKHRRTEQRTRFRRTLGATGGSSMWRRLASAFIQVCSTAKVLWAHIASRNTSWSSSRTCSGWPTCTARTSAM